MLAKRAIFVATIALSSFASTALAQTLMATAFTYQGRLLASGSPANGNYDLRFRLFDAAAGGAQKGPTVDVQNVAVSNGLFTTSIDFGAAWLDGSPRWLQIEVSAHNAGQYTTLAPRQAVTPTPYAIQ